MRGGEAGEMSEEARKGREAQGVPSMDVSSRLLVACCSTLVQPGWYLGHVVEGVGGVCGRRRCERGISGAGWGVSTCL